MKSLLVLVALVTLSCVSASPLHELEQRRMAVDYAVHRIQQVFVAVKTEGFLASIIPQPALASNKFSVQADASACETYFSVNGTQAATCAQSFNPSNFTSIDRYCKSNCLDVLKAFFDGAKVACAADPSFLVSAEEAIDKIRFFLEVPCARSQDGTLCFAKFTQWQQYFNVDLDDPTKNKSVITGFLLDSLCNDRCFPFLANILSHAASTDTGGVDVSHFGRVMELMCLRDRGVYCLLYLQQTPPSFGDSRPSTAQLQAAITYYCANNCFRKFVKFVQDISGTSVTSDMHLMADSNGGFNLDSICVQDPTNNEYCFVRAFNTFSALPQTNPCNPGGSLPTGTGTCSDDCKLYAQGILDSQGCCAPMLYQIVSAFVGDCTVTVPSLCTIPPTFVVKIGLVLRNVKFAYFQNNNVSRANFIVKVAQYFAKLSGGNSDDVVIVLSAAVLSSTSLQAAVEGLGIDASVPPPSLSLANSMAGDLKNQLLTTTPDFVASVPAAALNDPLASISVDATSLDVSTPPDISGTVNVAPSFLLALLSIIAVLLF